MALPIETLRIHIDYTEWSSRLLLEAAASLSQEEFIRDFGTADRSVSGTLAHVFAADRIWLGRIHGNPPENFFDPLRDTRLDVLQQEWPELLGRWKGWIAEQTDDSVQRLLSYKDLKGNPYQTPLWQIVLHVVNHGTHHRGQAAGMIRAMGHTPPALDLIRYYRTALS